jgi:hypothetical protein
MRAICGAEMSMVKYMSAAACLTFPHVSFPQALMRNESLLSVTMKGPVQLLFTKPATSRPLDMLVIVYHEAL